MVKIPRWAFEKFPATDRSGAGYADEVGRRGDGDRQNVQGGPAEAIRSLEIGRSGLGRPVEDDFDAARRARS